MRVKLTKTVIDGAEPKQTEYRLMDLEIPGFGVRVRPHGAKSFFLQWTPRGGTVKRVGIGLAVGRGSITVDAARAKARQYRNRILNDGADPLEDRRAQIEAVTFNELCDFYLESGVSHKKESTIVADTSRINSHIRPVLGKRRVKDLRASDVKSFQAAILAGKTATVPAKSGKPRGVRHVRGGRGTAARTVNLLSAILSFAVERGDIAVNPAHGLERIKDRKIRNFPTDEALASSSGEDRLAMMSALADSAR